MPILVRLLELGRSGSYDSVASVPGAGDHQQVCHLAGLHREVVIDFFDSLEPADQAALVRAIAVYEDTVRSLGSVTLMYHLIPRLQEPDHRTFDWVLRNTWAYWYYARGACSYQEYLEMLRLKAKLHDEAMRLEEARQAEAKKRIALESTPKLFNAIRRGDTKAVVALLTKGADPDTFTPDGVPLEAFARRIGRTGIADVLHRSCGKRNR